MKVLGTLNQDLYGGRYFFFPQYEITEDNNLTKITNQVEEYPNRGTIWLRNPPADIEYWVGTVIIVNLHTLEEAETFDITNPNRCKYQINQVRAIEYPKEREIIEVIELGDRHAEEMIDNDEMRTLDINSNLLNKRLLVINDNYVYGCFEIEEINKQKVKLITHANTNQFPSYSIRKYDKQTIVPLIKNIYINGENRSFIYTQDLLNNLEPIASLDFIDFNSLSNLLRQVLKDESDIQIANKTLQQLKRGIHYLNSTDIDFLEERAQRIVKKADLSNDLLEFKSLFMNEFFNSDRSILFKEEYIKNNPEIIATIARQDAKYDEGKVEFDGAIHELQTIKEDRIEEIKGYEKELIEIKQEFEKIKNEKQQYEDTMVEKKMMEYQMDISGKKEKIITLDAEITVKEEKLNDISQRLNISNEIEKLKAGADYFDDMKNNLELKVKELSKDYRQDFTKKVFEFFENGEINESIKRLLNPPQEEVCDANNSCESIPIYSDFEGEDIIKKVQNFFIMANREIDKEDIVNYLICISQGFITVFAGEPGVGKTSTCYLLSKALGLYDERFCMIPVGKGWTSSNDFIGYYNPLSRQFEKAPTDMYKVLTVINNEADQGIENIPYLILLDEANLSLIEYYWSQFMDFCNSTENGKVNLGGDYQFKIHDGLRFLATINFDKTTEPLSERFLDRAWVVFMTRGDNNIYYEDNALKNMEQVVDFTRLKEIFTPQKDEKLLPHLESAILAIQEKFDKKHKKALSIRSIKMIKNYCISAQKFMVGENRYKPLDYAIAQKVLPQLEGYGDEYGVFLKELLDVFRSFSLTTCSGLVLDMYDSGMKEHGYFKFFHQ